MPGRLPANKDTDAQRYEENDSRQDSSNEPRLPGPVDCLRFGLHPTHSLRTRTAEGLQGGAMARDEHLVAGEHRKHENARVSVCPRAIEVRKYVIDA